jgi:hypothetical protein
MFEDTEFDEIVFFEMPSGDDAQQLWLRLTPPASLGCIAGRTCFSSRSPCAPSAGTSHFCSVKSRTG